MGFPFVRDTFWSGDMWCQALRLTSDHVFEGCLSISEDAPSSSPGDTTMLLRTLQTPLPSCSSCLCM
ncbi:hypothetical protein LEMLEM_LOCUS9124 [Lemmus lemmus]